MHNLDIWNKFAKPPVSALKTIKGGRLSGMTDINPQWRYQAMTEAFGPCGQGWQFSIDKLWLEKGADDEVTAFALITLTVQVDDPTPLGTDTQRVQIPGIGGSKYITREKDRLHTNDEAYKMAVTDALSVAMKMLGVGAEIYLGHFDGNKYADEKPLPAPITPMQGVEDDHPTLWTDQSIMEFGVTLNRLFDENKILELQKTYDTTELDNGAKVRLWKLLPSNVRSAIRNRNAS